MSSKSFLGDEKGVSVVLGVILILAIAIVVFPVIYQSYIKKTMTGNESDHMDRVRKQFFELQSKVSWIRENESGIVRFPMNAESVSFSPGQSPLGTLAISTGGVPEEKLERKEGSIESVNVVQNSKFDGVRYWENEEIQHDGGMGYDSDESVDSGTGSIYISCSATGDGITAQEEAYWWQKFDEAKDSVVVNGAFRKELAEEGWGWGADIENADVRVDVYDNVQEEWITVGVNTWASEGNYDWTYFGTEDYLGSVTRARAYMVLTCVGGYSIPWGSLTAEGTLWMDNISVKSEEYVPGDVENAEITIDPGFIRFSGRNIYYPDQTYVYEEGHVILEQDDSEVMLEPLPTMIDWEKINEDRYKIEVEYPLISGENSSVSSSGSESIALTRKGDINRNGLTENFTLFVKTNYENAWLAYLEEEAAEMPSGLANADIDDDGNPYLNVSSQGDIISYAVTAENIKATT